MLLVRHDFDLENMRLLERDTVFKSMSNETKKCCENMARLWQQTCGFWQQTCFKLIFDIVYCLNTTKQVLFHVTIVSLPAYFKSFSSELSFRIRLEAFANSILRFISLKNSTGEKWVMFASREIISSPTFHLESGAYYVLKTCI